MTPSGSSRTSSRTKARRKLKPRRSCHYKKKHHHHHHPQINDIKKEEIDIPTESFPSPASSSIGSNDTINDSPKKLEDTYNSDDEVNNIEVSSTSSTITTTITTTTTCSTPKGRRFRIPETPMACPPAPKKPKVLSNCSLNKSSRVFFAPPELETFFLVALRDISV